MRFATLTLGIVIAATPALAECYPWPLRDVNGRFAYDGDSIYITLPTLPFELQELSIRVRGIDTPEIRARCDQERYLATAARDYVDFLLRNARQVEFCEPRWDKYGGRIGAEVQINGTSIAALMVQKGFARPYQGGKRRSWCD